MPRSTIHSAIAIVGIDIGKNVFHVVGQDKSGAIVLRQKWSRGQPRQRASLPGRYGSLCRRASPCPQAHRARAQRSPDACTVRSSLCHDRFILHPLRKYLETLKVDFRDQRDTGNLFF